MSIDATLKLNKIQIVFQQTTRCLAELINDSDEPLIGINSKNRKGAPTISLKNIKTGEMFYYADLLMPDAESLVYSIEPGGILSHDLQLSNFLQFPTAGFFELQAHYEWKDGKTQSAPVQVEVIRANPQSLITATSYGSQLGNIYAVWTNIENGKNALYFSKINSSFETKFEWSKKIAEIAESPNLAISIPPNAIPTRQVIAWISGSQLNYVIHTNGRFETKKITLDSDDYQIISPLLEDLFVEGNRQFTEVLLMKKNANGWQIQIVLLNDSPILSYLASQIEGIPPKWIQTAYRSTAERRNFFILAHSHEGANSLQLAMCKSIPLNLPESPIYLTTWNGTFMTADLLTTSDDRIVGAAFVSRKNESKTEYVIQKWQLTKNNELVLSTIHLIYWNENQTIEDAILNVNGEGATFALLKSANKWYWVNQNGEVSFLAELSEAILFPAKIIFIEQIYPAILYTDKDAGLKIHYLGPIRFFRPPTGA